MCGRATESGVESKSNKAEQFAEAVPPSSLSPTNSVGDGGPLSVVFGGKREAPMGDAGFELLRISPLTRFADSAMMADEVRELEADGYRCVPLDCSGWGGEDAFHAAMASALDFPDYYGRNLDAFNDCLSSIEVGGFRGLVLVFSHWEAFARLAGDRTWAVLDIIASASRFRLVYGDRLLALLHVADPLLQFEPVGRVGVVPSQREWRQRAHAAWASTRGSDQDV
jgi:RNAse (barnase) inhibitor barstar